MRSTRHVFVRAARAIYPAIVTRDWFLIKAHANVRARLTDQSIFYVSRSNFGLTLRWFFATARMRTAKICKGGRVRANLENPGIGGYVGLSATSSPWPASDILERVNERSAQSVAIKFIDPTTCNVAMRLRSENRSTPRIEKSWSRVAVQLADPCASIHSRWLIDARRDEMILAGEFV